MSNLDPRMDQIGAALADASRARMLCELMSGRAYTNKELASLSGIEPQTATAHLQKLRAVGVIVVERSGRFAYHRLASEQVADALEALAQLSPTDHLYRSPPGNARQGDPRILRSCYSHLAGRLAVRMTETMRQIRVLEDHDGGFALGGQASVFAERLGMVWPTATHNSAQSRAPAAKACLDWSERRPHLGGGFGRALMARGLEAGWLKREETGRALQLTLEGERVLVQVFGLGPADFGA